MTDATAPVSPNAPLMKAWERYKGTEAYASSFRWAAEEKHRAGSMWAAFSTGFAASFLQATAPTGSGSDKPCDPADPCSTAYDLACERNTLDGLLSETKDRLDAALAQVARLREALEWYGENARLARLIHSEGDEGRYAIANDGGRRARAALAETADTQPVTP